jgi:hypothetical protein
MRKMKKGELQIQPFTYHQGVRASMKSLLFVLALAGMTCFTGCISVPKDMFDPFGEVFRSVINFQLAEKRWPRDYEELSGFLKRSDDPTYKSLESVKFHRLDFIVLSDGGLKIYMDYTTASGDATVNDSFVLSKPKITPEQKGNGS